MPPTTLEAQGRPDLKIGSPEASDFLRNYKLPTAGQTYATSGISVSDTPAEAEIARLQAENARNIGPVDENSIYNSKLKQFQQEIDATNKIYAQKLAETQQQGLGNLGSSRAIQARSGLLGSDYGASQTANVTTQNNQQEDLVRAEQSAKIGAILGMVRQGAAEEIASKRAAQQSSLKDYMEYLGKASERKTNKLNALVSQLTDQGIDIKTVDSSELARLAKESGLSTSEITSAYNAKQKELLAAEEERNAKLIKDQSFTLGEGQDYYTYDPVTKKNVLVASKGKTYAPTASNGEIVPVGGTSPFVAQANYKRLNSKQRTQADSLNNLVRSLDEYKAYYNANPGILGGSAGNLVGADAGLLQTKLNSIIFAAAQAEGTGALQQADRQVIEQIIPNPTSIGGALNTAFRGGKAGNVAKIEDQINKYTNNLAGYGLVPISGGAPQTAEDISGGDSEYNAYLQSLSQ